MQSKGIYVCDVRRTWPGAWQILSKLAIIDYCAYPMFSHPPPKYLGHVEVEESRGMHVCEDAVKKLKAVSEGPEPGRGQA